MDNLELVCSCGHSVNVTSQGQSSFRMFRLKLRTSCPECYKVRKQTNVVVRLELPANGEFSRLKGSVYQLAWARDIRAEFIKEFKQTIDIYPLDTQQILMKLLMEYVNEKIDAGWWVEHSSDPLGGILRGSIEETHMATFDVIRYHMQRVHRTTRKSAK